MTHKIQEGPVRIAMDFPSAEAAMEWFETLRDEGAFGTTIEPGDEDKHPLLQRLRPRKDIGLRQTDSLDDDRVHTNNVFLVSSTAEAGHYLAIEEKMLIEAKLEESS